MGRLVAPHIASKTVVITNCKPTPSSHYSNVSPDLIMPNHDRSRNPSNSPPANKPATQTSFRFHVVDHPNKLKDRKQLRENRQHVMRDFLSKERQRPESTDARVKGSARVDKKRKRTPSQTVADVPRPSRSLAASGSHHLLAEPESHVHDLNHTYHPRAAAQQASNVAKVPAAKTSNLTNASPKQAAKWTGGEQRNKVLVTTARCPSPISLMTWKLDPFNSRPSFKDATLDTERLILERE